MPRLTRPWFALVALGVVPTIASSQTCPEAFAPRTAFEARADFSAPGAAQIRAHLADVIAYLEARDVSGLAPAQLAARRERIAHLADYAAEGAFPINDLWPSPTPIFIDAHDRACAVGDLMRRSGARPLAYRIALQQNFAYVPEIEEPGVAEWAAASGLTLDECALIQPTYGPCGGSGTALQYRTLCNPAALNSLGVSAYMSACGSNFTSQNDLVINVNSLPHQATCMLLCSRDAGFTANPAGSQGNLCLAGTIRRSPAFTASWGPWSAWASIPLDLQALPFSGGTAVVVPGDTWVFQLWYRDSIPTPTSNFSSAVAITFQ
ncbi:MAG: hypothetical protein R3F49_04190 [Planctomycetota bacterium]